MSFREVSDGLMILRWTRAAQLDWNVNESSSLNKRCYWQSGKYIFGAVHFE